jgi:hypothetical protein
LNFDFIFFNEQRGLLFFGVGGVIWNRVRVLSNPTFINAPTLFPVVTESLHTDLIGPTLKVPMDQAIQENKQNLFS